MQCIIMLNINNVLIHPPSKITQLKKLFFILMKPRIKPIIILYNKKRKNNESYVNSYGYEPYLPRNYIKEPKGVFIIKIIL